MDTTESERTSPKGLGGWLIVLLLAIWIDAAARLAAGVSALAAIFHVAVPAAFAAPMAPVSAAIAVAAGVLGAAAGFLLARKSPRGPAVARTLLSLNAGYYLLSLMMTVFQTGPIAAESVPAWLKPAGYLLFSVVGLAYLLRSRRVANTYNPELDAPNPADVFQHGENSDVLRNRIFPWEEIRTSDSSDPAAQHPASPELQTQNPQQHELPEQQAGIPEPPIFRSRIFAPDAMLRSAQPIPSPQGENNHQPSTRKLVHQTMDLSAHEEDSPAPAFAPEAPELTTHQSRIFAREAMLGPAQPIPSLREENLPLSTRKPAPPQADPSALEEAWPPRRFAPEAPATHQSRIFSREAMLGPDQPVPALPDENTYRPRALKPSPRRIDPPVREEVSPPPTLAPETPASAAQQSRVFVFSRDAMPEPAQPIPGLQVEHTWLPSTQPPYLPGIDLSAREETWPPRSFAQETPKPATQESRIFPREPMPEPAQPIPALQQEHTWLPSTQPPYLPGIDLSAREETWPPRSFAQETPKPATQESRVFPREPMPEPAQPIPALQQEHTWLPSTQPPSPRGIDLSAREETWPPRSFAQATPEPATQESRIFPREPMPEPAQPIPALQQEHTWLPSTQPPSPRGIDPSAHEETWPPRSFAQATPEPATQDNNQQPVSASEPPSELAWPTRPLTPEITKPAGQNGNGQPMSASQLAPPEQHAHVQNPQEPNLQEQDLQDQDPQDLGLHQPDDPGMHQPGQQTLQTQEPDPQELDTLKTRIAIGVTQWLAAATNGASRPRAHVALLDEAGDPLNAEEARQKLLDQVIAICDHAWSVCVGDSPTLPNTPDSGGSLPDELRKWAVAQAALRLTRSLDIRAAMEVNGPFERVAQDRECLMAIALKNSAEDAFGRKVDLADYDGHSGPEIAYRLILRAQRDMFEADLWAHVASLAGDPDFPTRFSSRGSKAFQESLEYWTGYASRRRDDHAPLNPVGAGFR